MFPEKTKFALEKILQADAEFQKSVDDQACDAEKQKQLAAALKVSIDEFIDVASSLWPKIRSVDTSKPSTTKPPPAE